MCAHGYVLTHDVEHGKTAPQAPNTENAPPEGNAANGPFRVIRSSILVDKHTLSIEVRFSPAERPPVVTNVLFSFWSSPEGKEVGD